MEIKSNIQGSVKLFGMGLILLVLIDIVELCSKEPLNLLSLYGFVIPVTTIYLCLFGLFCVTYGRTFYFNNEGCTVTFWRYKKHYSWMDLKIIQYQNCRSTWGYSGISKKADEKLIFSIKPQKIPFGIDIGVYSLFVHPLSSIWIEFHNHENEQASNSDAIYMVSKEKFLDKLKEWGVEVQYTNT